MLYPKLKAESKLVKTIGVMRCRLHLSTVVQPEYMGIDVKPIMFSNVEESSLQNITSTGEVKILGLGKLKEMFDMASRGTSAEEIYDRIFIQ